MISWIFKKRLHYVVFWTILIISLFTKLALRRIEKSARLILMTKLLKYEEIITVKTDPLGTSDEWIFNVNSSWNNFCNVHMTDSANICWFKIINLIQHFFFIFSLCSHWCLLRLFSMIRYSQRDCTIHFWIFFVLYASNMQ